MTQKPEAQPNTNRITRFLHVVEWLGNALPHPVSLFALFAAGVIVLSGILGYFEISVVDPRPVGARIPVEGPLFTGQRVLDCLFPLACGGRAAISGRQNVDFVAMLVG